MTRVAWVDCSSGVAGDMLLAALVDAGADGEAVRTAVAALGVPVEVTFAETVTGGMRALRADVTRDPDDAAHRTWADVRALLDGAVLDERVRRTAHDAFRRLAEAEAQVHGSAPDDVHFHEVGAHDAIADVVGCAAAVVSLGVDSMTASPIALGGGTARSAHGVIPVPGPAVLEILKAAAAPAHGGPVEVELCTPTGAAVLATLADQWGAMPAMTVVGTGAGAGTRELPGRPNAVRVVLGEAAAVSPQTELLLSTNVDDLDPRLWPSVLANLMAAGAADAWLVPILMKKGRPAHTLQVLCTDAVADAVRRIVFTQTTTIGLREQRVGKMALARDEQAVDVDGCRIRVKVAHLDGEVVNAQPEYEDVVAAATTLGRPVKSVLVEAAAAAVPGSGRPGA